MSKKLNNEWMVSTSITLPQSELEQINKECGGNRSQYLREIIMNRPKKLVN